MGILLSPGGCAALQFCMQANAIFCPWMGGGGAKRKASGHFLDSSLEKLLAVLCFVHRNLFSLQKELNQEREAGTWKSVFIYFFEYLYPAFSPKGTQSTLQPLLGFILTAAIL